MRIATGRLVWPISAIINGSNDAFCWHSHSSHGSDNKNLHLPYFRPKIWKLHYALWQMLRAITRTSLKLQASCFAFGVGQFKFLRQISLIDPCCRGNKNLEILVENLPQLGICRWFYVPDSCTSLGVFGVSQFICINEICLKPITVTVVQLRRLRFV